MDYRRTNNCGDLRISDIGKNVVLSGWVHRRRDHGGLIFVDLRDRYGTTQVVCDPNGSTEAHNCGSMLRSEWVISLRGTVRERAPGMDNPKLQTGEIEVLVKSLNILSKSQTPPFSICDGFTAPNEELRLKYRYLDMRRGLILKNLEMRHKALIVCRDILNKENFIEVSTPLLGKSTPEGARDYLVPSRNHTGTYYALPQSPQIFKQLLMVGGLDRYFQIAPCLRDEDLRADRQPEFMQIDLEMSFANPDDIMGIVNAFIRSIFLQCIGVKLPNEIPVIKYSDAMERYGTDRPDMRFGMELVRIDDIVRGSSFTIFNHQLDQGGIIKAICVKGGAKFSRSEIDGYGKYAIDLGLDGLAWMKMDGETLQSSIAKFFSDKIKDDIIQRLRVQDKDLLLFAAGPESVVNQSLDHLRRKISKDMGLVSRSDFSVVWVNEFPCFEWSDKDKKYTSAHHPFTMPYEQDLHLLDTRPLEVRAYAYDLVINGYEVGGGSQRVHDCELQRKIFERLSLTQVDIDIQFGFFVTALEYGAPPHAGCAIGLDRLIMLLCEEKDIKNVIAFPKTQSATDIMANSPSPVSKERLQELHITTTVK